jgi:WD40 repeat protein
MRRRVGVAVAIGGAALSLLLLPFGGARAAFVGYNGDTPEVAYDSSPGVHSTGAGTASISGGTDPAWSPDGTKLAYVKGGDVHVAGPDGSNEVGTAVAGSKPAWSPDGAKIAYVGTDGDIHVKDITGSAGSDVTNSVADDEDPAWSPDGSKIAFVRKAGSGTFSIWVMNADGGGQTQLTSGSANDRAPAWSPDGGTIAFQSDRDGSEQIYTMSSSGGNVTRLTSGSSSDAVEPTYSPQGDLIAFVRPGTGLRTIGSDGSNETSLTSGGSDENPDFRSFAPRNDVVPSVGGTFQVGDTLAADPGSWTGAAGDFTYQWARCGLGGGCTDISGATDSSYLLVSADQNNQMIVRVTARNAGGLATTVDSHLSPQVDGPGPKIIDLPTITLPSTAIDGAPVVGSALFATTGTWQSAYTLTFTYQWKKCQPDTGACYAIKGATSSSFIPTVDQAGWEIRVGVTAHSDHGDPEVNSRPTKAVTGLVPSLRVTPQILGTNMVGQTLSVSTGSWTGTAPITFTFDWRRCDPFGNLPTCVSIPGMQKTTTVSFTTSTYTLTDADLNQTIRVYITGKNAIGSFTGITNHTFPTVPRRRLAPAATTAPSISGKTHPGAELIASIGTWSGDQPITYQTSWQRCDATAANCKTIKTKHRLSYVVGRSDLGRTFVFRVTATNPVGPVTATSSPTPPITLGPKPPRGRRIVGTNRSEYLPGGGGNDRIRGRGGNDTIMGGAGNDVLAGGPGNDVIDGGPGFDRILGGKGSDTIIASDGSVDVIDCGAGNDRVFADSTDILRNCEAVTYSAPAPSTPRRR